ncbi:MAG: energy-coupling factor transporter transmembrane protein EcfT [Caldilineaceae bacterium]|nr:energy-coupling factor transporter transmembrane protein EcfT [Caldilineaceae bacterium]
MEEFDLLRNVTIGQYIPTGSAIHRLDPRAKILAATFLILAISFNTSIVANLLFLLVTLALAKLSRIEFRYILRGLLLGLPILIFIFIMQFLFLGGVEPAGKIYVEWGWFRLTRYGLQTMTISLIRIISFIFLTSLVTMTATTTELTHGVERILHPFRRFGVPAHELALILTIALRFVPTLAEEAERILKAQASRGADVSQRRIWRPDKAAKAYLPLIVPLFLGAFRRAEDLVYAMEARCYVSGEGRTKFVLLQSTWIDYLVVIAAFLFMLVMAFYPWPAVKDIVAGLGWPGL